MTMLDLMLVILFLFAIFYSMIGYFKFRRTDQYVKREMRNLEYRKKEHIKWQINQNLAAKKRKKAIYDLMDSFDFRDIKLDEKSDKFYVIIKINKDVLIEREIK